MMPFPRFSITEPEHVRAAKVSSSGPSKRRQPMSVQEIRIVQSTNVIDLGFVFDNYVR